MQFLAAKLTSTKQMCGINSCKHQGVNSATYEDATNSWVSTTFTIDLPRKHLIYTKYRKHWGNSNGNDSPGGLDIVAGIILDSTNLDQISEGFPL